MAKQKYYVVWNGPSPGVYSSWEACQEAVSGVSGAKYKSFKTQTEAEDAFEMGEEEYSLASGASEASDTSNSSSSSETRETSTSAASKPERPAYNPAKLPAEAIREAIAVDAACSGNPGAMEYRGVYLADGKEIFHYGPVHGTNNIGEFLAIVHGLALLKQKGLDTMPIYSDSVNAQLWVRKHQCKTTLVRNDQTEKLYQMIERAEAWLRNNTYKNPIIKWQTDKWGEIPADFGRK